MGLYNTVEQTMLSSTYGEVGLTHLIAQWGIRVAVFKPPQTVFRDVYGKQAGEEGFTQAAEIDAVVLNDQFAPIDARKAGTFIEGWMYARDPKVNVGDRVEVIRDDGRSRRFKVDEVQGIGTTTSVLKRFKILAIGD